MNHGSLFSGIGGFDLAAEWMGWNNVFHCEINPFGQRVLKYYWPNAISYDDITKTDFTIHRGNIDILTGGFPCQPYSMAGKRKGKEDERHLWPEMLRAIREIQPEWIVGENVSGIINWNGGMVFNEVQAEMEAEGYEVLPFLLPACSVGAPHKRERVWFIANTGLQRQAERQKQPMGIDKLCQKQSFANTNGRGLEKRLCRFLEESEKNTNVDELCHSIKWDNFPTEPPVRSGNDGFPSKLDGLTIPKHRNESIKAYGNAVVPPLVLQIFKSIQQYELTLKNKSL